MPTVHKLHGSSTASRDIACPGWTQAAKGMPRKSSAAAIDGTMKHRLVELKMLDRGQSLELLIGTPCDDLLPEVHLYEREHVEAARAFVAAIDASAVELGYRPYDILPEVFVQGEAEDIGGTGDIFIVDPSQRRALVGDVKTGAGHQVSPKTTDQLPFLAYNAYHDPEFPFADEMHLIDRFDFVIWQPDLDGDLQTKTHTMSRDEVLAWGTRYMAAVALSRKDNAPLSAGSHCAFCPAAPVCPEKTGAARRALLMDPDTLTDLAEALELAESLAPWITTVREAALEQLEEGAAIDGWKLVAKRAVKKWVDEERATAELTKRLGDKAFVTKLITPAQAQKAVKGLPDADDVDALIVSESSGTTIARESSKRTTVLSTNGLAAALAAVK